MCSLPTGFFFMAIFIINNNKVKVTGAGHAYMKFRFDPRILREVKESVYYSGIALRSIGQRLCVKVRAQDMALTQVDTKWGEVIGVARILILMTVLRL